VIRLEGARRAFKYLRVSALARPERLVLDLYSAKPPSRSAEIRAARGGCLRLTSVSAGGRRLGEGRLARLPRAGARRPEPVAPGVRKALRGH